MALLFRLSLFLLLVPLIPTAASHHHSPAGGGGAAVPLHPRRHHRSVANTATALFYTAPSMHQNHIEAEEGQSLQVLDPFAAAPAAAEAPSGEAAIAAVGAAAEEATPTLIDDSPQQAAAAPPPTPRPPPPPPLFAKPDLDSTAPSQPQEEGVEGYGSATATATAAPPLDEPAAATATTTTRTTLPLPRYGHAASPPPPVHAGVAGLGDEQRLEQLARVLSSLGYNEMASAAPLLANSALLGAWPGSITVFAAPDVFLRASCPMCSRRHVLLEHIALGYFPYSELAAAPTAKLPSASPGFCLNLASERGPFAIHHVRLYVDDVEVSHPELYNDGRYVVHGLHGFLPPLSHGSCSHGSHHRHHYHYQYHHHHITASSAATSAATATSVVRIMIREAIARLRDSGYGFVALAMRVKFAELERLANMTVFALDDQAIFVGGGHDYVSAVRFHVVPGHRLTHADLQRLHPGTMLPTLAGEGQNLVVTQGASGSGSGPSDVRINYIPIKDPDVVINSRIALHGVYVPFPRLHLANLAAAVALASSNQINGTCGVFGDCASAAATSTTVPAAPRYGEGQ
uniref:FAS1 domain-containing protein n=1 Tax=Oryza punctata TaxID=4537 RepID=A0A0E0JZX9_ORYPU